LVSASIGGTYAARFADGKTARERERELDRGLTSEDTDLRISQLAFQTAQSMGGFSAWHSFRSAVRSRPDDFPFLGVENTPGDLFSAPFRFDFLSRPSTFIPLGVAAAVGIWLVSSMPKRKVVDDGRVIERKTFTAEDAFFAGAYSFNAGTHEEALFRGYVLPMAHYITGSPLAARWIDSILFALAHLNNVPVPVAQWALGFHLGRVVQSNNYGLEEAVFIHTWWDVLIFAASFHQRMLFPDESAHLPAPVLWLPKISLVF
jgi:membrane protease YdiL (CAAX protease family)